MTAISLVPAIRTLHVLTAALWMGSAAFISLFIFPTLRQLGAAGEPVILQLAHRRLQVFMPVIAGTTVLTGLWLYWEFSAGLNPVFTHSAAGITIGLGGLIGIAALVEGAAVLGRGVKRMTQLVEQAQTLPEGAERAALQQAVAVVQTRLIGAGKLSVLLVALALILMALGHYI